MTDLQTILDMIAQSRTLYADVFTAAARYLVPALAALLLPMTFSQWVTAT